MPIRARKPAEDQGSADGYAVPAPLVFEKFNGINTSTTRPGVPDEQMAWCDGWFPLGPRYLRTLWDVGPALWMPPTGTIAFFDFANIGTLPIMVAVTSVGGIWQVVTITTNGVPAGTATRIAADGTIISPLRAQVGISQWGSQYVLIVANQTNGYFIWDGSLLYEAGTLAPTITITNVGSGYQSAPAVVFSGGSGSGASGTATIANGIVTGAVITNPGFGWLATDVVAVSFVGGTLVGSDASLTANMALITGGSGASIIVSSWSAVGGWYLPASLTVLAGGSDYSQFATATWTYPSGKNVNDWAGGSAPGISLTISDGIITGATLVPNPSNINMRWDSPPFPTASETDSGSYVVSSVTVVDGGTDYSSTTAVTATGGTTPSPEATLVPVIVNGVITSVRVINGGSYGDATQPTLAVADSAVTALGTVNLTPFGIQGTTVETYSGHVWIANGAVITFSAPGSVTDFATSDGGGNFTSVDSFLRVAYIRLVNSNGFLYLIADSSVNYLSGVQTVTPSGGLPTTTFTNQNADPEVGCPYAGAVDVFSRNIVFANAFGAHVSYGAAVTKISELLDGVYNTVPNFGGFQLSACKSIIFGRKVWAVLVPVIDPVTNLQVNKLFIWDSKKWVSTEQSVNLVYVQHQEIASIITAWGTDGLSVYPLFNTPSNKLKKTVQSRLWDTPGGYQNQKAAVRLWGMAQFLGSESLSYTVSIDNEFGLGTGSAIATGSAVGFSWVDAAGAAFSWVAASSAPFTWAATGTNVYAILPPQSVGQQGVLTGMTTTTNADDMILISEMVESEIVGYRG